MIFTFLIPRGGGNSTNIEVGSAPSQVPTNNIVNNIINQNNTIINQNISTAINNVTEEIIQQVNNNITQEINNIINNPEVVRPFNEATCTESLEEGMYIKVYRDGDETKCCRTDPINGLLATGFVLANYNVGETVKYYDSGENSKGNDLGAGKLYLSTSIKGRASLTPPSSKSGHWFQEIGESVGPNRHLFKLGLSIQLL